MGTKEKLDRIRSILQNTLLTPSEKLDRIIVESKQNSIDRKNKNYSIKQIEILVFKHFYITDDQLQSKTRKDHIVKARQVSHYLASNFTNETLEYIGSYFGGKKHSTVLSSIRRVEHLLKSDKHFYARHSEFIESFKDAKDSETT